MARKKDLTVEDLKLQIKQKRNELKQTEQQLRALELEEDARLGKLLRKVCGGQLERLNAEQQEVLLSKMWMAYHEANAFVQSPVASISGNEVSEV